MFKLKLAVVGPPKSGKTFICNYLAEATESSGGEYHPTQGVRILEFESEGEDPNAGKSFKVEVELWDCGGSKRFETCWSAFSKDTNGVIIMYDPDNTQQEEEIEKWYSYFVKQQDLKDSHCLLLARHTSENRNKLNSSMMAGVQYVEINFEDPEGSKAVFSKFLTDICSASKEIQDQVEQVIVNQHDSY